MRCSELNERKIIRELSRILKVDEGDIPKTIQRFKKEIEELKKGISN
jgi:transposase-like protein